MKIKKILLFVGTILGLGIMFYPLFSQIYYDIESQVRSDHFADEVKETYVPSQIQKNIKLARAYNEALAPNLSWNDPYTDEERSEGVQSYAKMLEVQEKIGVVHIPSISLSLPIYAGTNERILQKGVGHLEGTSLPIGGENTHSVLTAHRGLPQARLFTDLDKLNLKDIFSVSTINGDIFYEVDQIIIIAPTETDKVKIEPGKDYLTLLTCTPYMINSHRLLVRGRRITDFSPAQLERVQENKENVILYYIKVYASYLFLLLITLLIMSYIWLINSRKMEKKASRSKIICRKCRNHK